MLSVTTFSLISIILKWGHSSGASYKQPFNYYLYSHSWETEIPTKRTMYRTSWQSAFPSFHALFLIAWLANGDSLMCCIVTMGRQIAKMFSTFCEDLCFSCMTMHQIRDSINQPCYEDKCMKCLFCLLSLGSGGHKRGWWCTRWPM